MNAQYFTEPSKPIRLGDAKSISRALGNDIQICIGRLHRFTQIFLALLPFPICVNLRNLRMSLPLSNSGCRLLCDADVLGLGEEAKGLVAAFAADPALFHAAEGHAQVADEPAVYPDGPRV